MTDTKITDRKWQVQGMNGTWFVEEYREQNHVWDSGTYDRVHVGTKKDATALAQALNRAYRAGRWERAGT